MGGSHVFFWFRRDLRLNDNHGLYRALTAGKKVIPVFIFDRNILSKLSHKNDSRVEFIHRSLSQIRDQLKVSGSDLAAVADTPEQAWKFLFETFGPADIYTNEDYEPYAIERDTKIAALCRANGAQLFSFKDQVIFAKNEIVKDDGKPYTVYTPYSKKWKAAYTNDLCRAYPSNDLSEQFHTFATAHFPSLNELGFEPGIQPFPPAEVSNSILKNYATNRDFPAAEGTSRISIHLRFGTVSVRQLYGQAGSISEKWVNELIWREFYKQILWHFPHVTEQSFDIRYDRIPWLRDEAGFAAWCRGETGYPIVDAGMRELNTTGFMHNRVRMIVASFLTKHLLIDWRWGEAYFADKLLDFDLSSNNGGWQWAAGCGVDAAPYFRIFNPEIQTKKFDPEFKYIRRWVPEFNSNTYPSPIVDHSFARERCLQTYKAALNP